MEQANKIIHQCWELAVGFLLIRTGSLVPRGVRKQASVSTTPIHTKIQGIADNAACGNNCVVLSCGRNASLISVLFSNTHISALVLPPGEPDGWRGMPRLSSGGF